MIFDHTNIDQANNKMLNFVPKVESKVGKPIINSDSVVYPAGVIIKLESGSFREHNSGITVLRSKDGGKVLVSLTPEYDSKIRLKQVVNQSEHNSEQVKLILYNITDDFIRIEKDEPIFIYKWTPDENYVRASPFSSQSVAEPVDEEKETEPVAEPVVEEKETEPVAEEKETEPVAEEKETESVAEPVSEGKEAEPVAEPVSEGKEAEPVTEEVKQTKKPRSRKSTKRI